MTLVAFARIKSELAYLGVVSIAGMLMHRLTEMLKELDTPLWKRLEIQELKPQFYAFRWLTLLLSQEFALPGKLFINNLNYWNSCLCADLLYNFFHLMFFVKVLAFNGDLFLPAAIKITYSVTGQFFHCLVYAVSFSVQTLSFTYLE